MIDTVIWINLAGVLAILGLGWRGYSKLDSKIDTLGSKLEERIANLGERVARIEGMMSVTYRHEEPKEPT